MVQDVTADDMEIVSALRAALVDRVGQQRFDLWFGASTRLVLRDGVLKIEVPNRFYQDWLRANFRGDIEACSLSAAGKPLAVEFCIDPELENAKSSCESNVGKSSGETKDETQGKAPAGGKRNSAAARRRRFAELASFVVGHSNRVAHASAQMVAELPGCPSLLTMHGPTGLIGVQAVPNNLQRSGVILP